MIDDPHCCKVTQKKSPTYLWSTTRVSFTCHVPSFKVLRRGKVRNQSILEISLTQRCNFNYKQNYKELIDFIIDQWYMEYFYIIISISWFSYQLLGFRFLPGEIPGIHSTKYGYHCSIIMIGMSFSVTNPR